MAEVNKLLEEARQRAEQGQIKAAIAWRDALIERLRTENAKLRAEHAIDHDDPRYEEYEEAPVPCYKCGAETVRAFRRAHHWICEGCWQEEHQKQVSEPALKKISGQLDALTKLVALGLCEGKSRQEQIEILAMVMAPKQIADLLGTTPNTISVALYHIKKAKPPRKKARKGQPEKA